MTQCTLVTALYSIPSKFPSTTYLEWARNFLMIQNPIVLFTTKELAPYFEDIRTKRLHIVVLPFEELYMWKQYEADWKFHKTIDHEPYHTPELYAIWAQKSVFVELAIEANPFQTEYFYWCDIGSFRSKPTDAMIRSFPMGYRLPKGKILFSSIANFVKEDLDGDFRKKDRIVGGLWGGDQASCIRWRQAYEAMLLRYFAEGKFAGKDQSVMLSTYLEHPHLAEIVEPTIFSVNPWFFAHSLLSDESVDYVRNTTYPQNERPVVAVRVMGGLGNQLFQVATAYAYAKQNGGKLQILRNKLGDDGRPTYWDSVLKRFAPYLTDTLPNIPVNWSEIQPTLYSAIPPLPKQGICLHGYLQSSKYFGDAILKDELRRLLKPTPEDMKNIQTYDLLESKDRVVVIHARRTDYLKTAGHIHFHGPLDIAYYQRATEYVCSKMEQPIFLLSSDDPMYWMDILASIPAFQTHPFHILAKEDEVRTFMLLQQFSNFVLANSTFSWWYTWLAKSNLVIAPEKWFGPGGPQNNEDIYEPDWIRL